MSADLRAYWRKVARAQQFHVRVVARGERERAIMLGKNAVLRSKGRLLDFRAFSKRSLSMVVAMRGSGVLSLVDTLEALGWDVDLAPDREALARRASDLLGGTFRLTFPQGDGELAPRSPSVAR